MYESFEELMERLYLIKAALALPDPNKLKAGTYRGEPKVDWFAPLHVPTSIFETSTAGFAPVEVTASELKSYRQWNKEQREKKRADLTGSE